MKELLAGVDGGAVRAALERDGTFTLDVDGTPVILAEDDLQIRASSHEELALAQAGPLAVALDTTLDEALRREGLAREVVRALNDQRKAQGFEIADRVVVVLSAAGELGEAISQHRDWIAGEVLATELRLGTNGDAGGVEVAIDGSPLGVGLSRAG